MSWELSASVPRKFSLARSWLFSYLLLYQLSCCYCWFLFLFLLLRCSRLLLGGPVTVSSSLANMGLAESPRFFFWLACCFLFRSSLRCDFFLFSFRDWRLWLIISYHFFSLDISSKFRAQSVPPWMVDDRWWVGGEGKEVQWLEWDGESWGIGRDIEWDEKVPFFDSVVPRVVIT